MNGINGIRLTPNLVLLHIEIMTQLVGWEWIIKRGSTAAARSTI